MDAENGADEEEEEEGAPGPLAWEQQEVPLPRDLLAVLQRHVGGDLQVDARSLMEGCPKWQLLKQKAEQNNHRNDAGRPADRALKQVQQKILGLLRLYPLVHQELPTGTEDADEVQALSQQLWGLLLELEHYTLQERKKMSLPGTIMPEGPQLFSMEDLKLQNEQAKLQSAGDARGQMEKRKFPQTSTVFSPACPHQGTWCLCHSTGGKGSRWKGGGKFKFRSWTNYGKGLSTPSWRWQGGRGKGSSKGKGKGKALYPSA